VIKLLDCENVDPVPECNIPAYHPPLAFVELGLALVFLAQQLYVIVVQTPLKCSVIARGNCHEQKFTRQPWRI
jgi:hypothetical protein